MNIHVLMYVRVPIREKRICLLENHISNDHVTVRVVDEFSSRFNLENLC